MGINTKYFWDEGEPPTEGNFIEGKELEKNNIGHGKRFFKLDRTQKRMIDEGWPLEKKERTTGKSSVYFIQSDRGGPVKIGRSKKPKQRVKGVQTGNPYKLVIRLLIINAGGRLEKKLHKLFQANNIRGEWFKEKTMKSFYRWINHAFHIEEHEKYDAIIVPKKPDNTPKTNKGLPKLGPRNSVRSRGIHGQR